MKNVRMTICLMAVVLFMAAGRGFGTIEFKDGGTHDINYTISEVVNVDYQAPSMQTTVNLLNGALIPGPSKLQAFEDSRINIFSGAGIRDLYAYDRSQVTMSGGFFSSCLYVLDSSRMTMSGGTIGHEITLIYSAILTLDGSNFAIDGIPVGFGELTSTLGGLHNSEPYRQLTGTLSNGDIMNNPFQIGNDAKIVLVPEPATLLLLGLGGVMLRRKNQQQLIVV